MATVKKMARVVILKRLGYDLKYLPIFEEVGSLPDADLLIEYNTIVAERQADIAHRREQLTAETAEKTAQLNTIEGELS